jgi:hypothetical protein
MMRARIAACAVLVVLLPAAAVAQPPAEAVSVADESATATQPALAALARRRITELFNSAEFKHTDKTTGIRLRHRDDPQKPPPWMSGLLDLMVKATRFLAGLGEVVLWALVVVLTVVIVVLRGTWLPYLCRGQRGGQGTQAVAGVDQAQIPASLPEDIPGSAMARWHEGRHAEALSVLYRGALRVASERLKVPFAPGATEGEALHAVTAAQPPLHDYFQQLTAAWVGIAYAGRDPPDIETLVAGYRRQLEAGP